MAFEEEGFTIVRGPDLLWGGDIRTFHPPAGKFDGVIGGPPCQAFSQAITAPGFATRSENLIPEFERCVMEAQPGWFLMENVKDAPIPNVESYGLQHTLLNCRWLGEKQNRVRRFSFGSQRPMRFNITEFGLEHPEWEACVLASEWRGSCGGPGRRKPHTPSRPLPSLCEAQGLPPDFLAKSPFTQRGRIEAVGNGVPLPMGRAVAKAVKRALGL